jgi:hypothetical protein
MATKKKMGRPKLTAAQKKERTEQTKVSIMLNPFQLGLLEDWIQKDGLLKTKPMTRKDAVLYLMMSRLSYEEEGRTLIGEEELSRRAAAGGYKSKRK